MGSADEKHMQIALALAEKGIGCVEPNPAVGCVIVRDGEILGRGFHEIFGGPHAEINALADCRENGFSPKGATMYVTLEPCCYTGKTPPCTEAIIAAKISRVVASTTDATEKVAGKGFEILTRAAIVVDVGLCQEQARQLNAAFFKYARTKMPWVIVKWAQSDDGFLSRTDGDRWITSSQSRQDVQRIRVRVQAILVGINTVIDDDPLLTLRSPEQKPLLRVVLDSKLRISIQSKLLQTISQSPVLIVTAKETLVEMTEKAKAIKKCGAEIFVVQSDDGRCDIRQVLNHLGKVGIQQVLIEGGRAVLDSFIGSDFADEGIVYISPEKLDSNGSVKISEKMRDFLEAIKKNGSSETIGPDIRIKGFCRRD
ncbi:MAG: bifunctional diaminohydroxyphosphoribosylaminopyrimidine deaminase/5-amino-6-(5-phosphoribosylamino)uracil reductase RibD [Anaerohalosphaeraceae bacterium]|nr:bifunctional diaminohydroxyphosphoribosylaminopyrimidine deaminase/5-amino-6-(5-phosphoribosylamino)uracil reductase RibD [Anaerohalosphaeraceae bacterium]